MKKIILSILVVGLALLTGCTFLKTPEVYNGRLEAETVKLSAQNAGIVEILTFKEGDQVKKGEILAVINKQKLYLQRKQILADLAFNRDLLAKTERLLVSGAATRQQRNELRTRVSVLNSQKANLDLQMRDGTIKSPLNGIVLNKFINQGELAAPGSLVVEVADLSELEALIYVPLQKLPEIKLGQKVAINIDGVKSSFPGKVTWIASESEFTPKTILTKETRTTLVYAVKLSVPNKEGNLKIGMPIDVSLLNSPTKKK